MIETTDGYATTAATTDARAMDALDRTSVHDGVRERLKAYITNGGLQPGDRLPGEIELAAQLGVGRSAVREALRAMEAVGAIETRNGLGRFVGSFAADSYVRNFTTESLIQSFSRRELMEARCLLEIAAMPQAVEQLTDDDLAEISRLMDQMRSNVAAGASHAAEDLGMHRIIMRHISNRLIAAMLDALYALALARYRNPDPTWMAEKSARSQIDLAEHAALVEAILKRDGNLAQRRVMEHFETTAKRLGFVPTWRALFAASQPVSPSSAESQAGESVIEAQ